MNLSEKLEYIGSKKMLRVERWRKEPNTVDGLGAWRAGIEWYSEDKYIFICEYPSLEQCLDAIIKYMEKNKRIIVPPLGYDLKWEVDADTECEVLGLCISLLTLNDDIKTIKDCTHEERLKFLKHNGFSIKKVKTKKINHGVASKN